MPLFRSKVRFKEVGGRRVGWVTPEFYDAKGNGLVNDRPALDAAIQDLLDTDGGGELELRPGGRYRLDSQLTVPGPVHFRARKGVPGAETALIRNHILPLLSISNDVTSGVETPTVIEGVTFTDAAAGGAMVVVAEGSVELVRCALLGVPGITDNSQPLLLMAGSIRDVCRASRCRFSMVSDQVAIGMQTGVVAVDGASIFKVPATYTGNVISIASNDANIPAHLVLNGGTDFDATAHTSGAVVLVSADGLNWGVSAESCRFRRGSAAATAFAWTNAGVRRMNIGANSWDFIAGTRYAPAVGATPFVRDSELALVPYGVVDGVGTTHTVPTGVKSFTIRFQSTAPTVTMPPALFAGQEIKITIYNASGASWAGATISGALAGTSGQIDPNTSRTFSAHVIDRDLSGTYEWVSVGWSGMA